MFADCPQDYVWIRAWEGGSTWCLGNMDLHGRLKRLAYSRIDLSLLQRQSTSQEKHGRLRHFPASVNLGPGDRRLCMRLVLVSFTQLHLYETLHNRHFSVTSEESFRDSEPSDIFLLGTRAPRDRILQYIKLVLVSFTLISHIVSCMLH